MGSRERVAAHGPRGGAARSGFWEMTQATKPVEVLVHAERVHKSVRLNSTIEYVDGASEEMVFELFAPEEQRFQIVFERA